MMSLTKAGREVVYAVGERVTCSQPAGRRPAESGQSSSCRAWASAYRTPINARPWITPSPATDPRLPSHCHRPAVRCAPVPLLPSTPARRSGEERGCRVCSRGSVKHHCFMASASSLDICFPQSVYRISRDNGSTLSECIRHLLSCSETSNQRK